MGEALDRIGSLYAISKLNPWTIARRAARAVRQELPSPAARCAASLVAADVGNALARNPRLPRSHFLRADSAGMRCNVIATTGRSRSTTTRRSAHLRCVALGRKNFLFAGSDGEAARVRSVLQLAGQCEAQRPQSRSVLARGYSHASPTIRSIALPSCCLGTSNRRTIRRSWPSATRLNCQRRSNRRALLSLSSLRQDGL